MIHRCRFTRKIVKYINEDVFEGGQSPLIRNHSVENSSTPVPARKPQGSGRIRATDSACDTPEDQGTGRYKSMSAQQGTCWRARTLLLKPAAS